MVLWIGLGVTTATFAAFAVLDFVVAAFFFLAAEPVAIFLVVVLTLAFALVFAGVFEGALTAAFVEAFVVSFIIDFPATLAATVILLPLPGVGVDVQYQLPLASAHACPSCAVL
jgi:hypothetical protein